MESVCFLVSLFRSWSLYTAGNCACTHAGKEVSICDALPFATNTSWIKQDRISIPVGRVGQSVYRPTGRSGDRILVGARFSAPVQTGPGAHPASCTMDTGSFPGVESGRGVTLTPHPLLVPRSKKSRDVPLLSPRAFVDCKKGETYLEFPFHGSFFGVCKTLICSTNWRNWHNCK
jgi:hypothetical protein